MEDCVFYVLLFLNTMALMFFWKMGVYDNPSLTNYSVKNRMIKIDEILKIKDKG